MKRPLPLLLGLCLSSTAWAERSISYDEALQGALRANPNLELAERSVEQSDADLVASNATWDPVLTVNGSYRSSKSLTYNPPVPDPFAQDQQSWNAGVNLNATAPTGTTLNLDTSFLEGVQ